MEDSRTSNVDAHVERACARLTRAFGSKVFPGRSGQNFWFYDAKQAAATPVCRMEPDSAEEVSAALKILVEERCPFAVSSGGMARGVGSSNADGGVTIDLVRMNSVTVADDRQTVTLGAGARWMDVYEVLDAQGLTVPGGGISFYSGRRGWACDGITSYELVLPSSQIVVVDRATHPDLFFALRGAGSCNFGIVTSFTMAAMELSDPKGIWMGLDVYRRDQVPRFLDAVQTVWAGEDPDLGMGAFYTFSPTAQAFSLIVFSPHVSHQADRTRPTSLAVFDDLERVPDTSQSAVVPMAEATRMIGRGAVPGQRNRWVTFTYRPSREFDHHLYSIYEEEALTLQDRPGFNSNLLTQLLPRRTAESSDERGHGCLGVPDHGTPLVLATYAWSYLEAADDQAVEEVARRCFRRTEAKAKELEVWHPFRYINYADEAIQATDVWDGYGPETVARLRAIQKQVDPDGVFTSQGLARGYFKLNPHL
ncbi:hypothetical protein BJX61DRAFT_540188 [Aspergillus egyptiacus]|nr:hypothetical protein BJX61DRAFT_540188 [Aspergillus egyptiacus]